MRKSVILTLLVFFLGVVGVALPAMAGEKKVIEYIIPGHVYAKVVDGNVGEVQVPETVIKFDGTNVYIPKVLFTEEGFDLSQPIKLTSGGTMEVQGDYFVAKNIGHKRFHPYQESTASARSGNKYFRIENFGSIWSNVAICRNANSNNPAFEFLEDPTKNKL
jgi:hypothetical protein